MTSTLYKCNKCNWEWEDDDEPVRCPNCHSELYGDLSGKSLPSEPHPDYYRMVNRN